MSDVWVRDDLPVVFDREALRGTHDRCFVRASQDAVTRDIRSVIDFGCIEQRVLSRAEITWLGEVKSEIVYAIGLQI